MGRKKKEYPEVRGQMKPGDIIAFSGKANFSELIKWATRAPVSHVGIILQSKLLVDNVPQSGYFNQIIESTSLDGFSGVSISRLSDRIETYNGGIWWLPLSDEVRSKLNFEAFYNFLLHQEKKPYDTPQAVKSALDALDNVPLLSAATHNVEDFSKFFCSELAAAALEKGGAIGSINSAEVTPIDLCMFSIYQKDYYLLKYIVDKDMDKDMEKATHIRAYNSISPEGWGE
ncbi:hypothetical protein NC796_00140 [Aliifodinibius sp. S!AR15-10]|uniref:hypothetical protein n=1 Tax=Aliifodinibius sp. S!AR15-10 TaxID=2950437 RepID=UPI00285AF24A|nr:hypothetical protein [Aliifodinibius sp. S!AR15-10]MDR8389522.1 hypothetical protein [Aliifodinibius sp. S!AR15-10]